MVDARNLEDYTQIRGIVEGGLSKLQDWLEWRLQQQEDILRSLGSGQPSPISMKGMKNRRNRRSLRSRETGGRSGSVFGDSAIRSSGSKEPTRDPSLSAEFSPRLSDAVVSTQTVQNTLRSLERMESTSHSKLLTPGKSYNNAEREWEQLQEWETKLMIVFDELDFDRTGSIDSSELMEAFKEVGMPECLSNSVFQYLDKDFNGSIDRLEWLHMLAETDRGGGDDMKLLMEFLDRLAERQRAIGRIYDKKNRKRTYYVVRHDSVRRMVWDACMLVSLVWISVSVPYSLGFDFNRVLNVLDRFTDILFCCDVLLNFRTTYVDKHDMVVYDTSKIAMNYLRSWFCLDFVSSVPFDLITAGLLPDLSPARLFKIGKVAKVLKLLRIGKMFELHQIHNDSEFILSLEHSFTSSLGHRLQRVVQLVFIAFFVAHWLACFGMAIDTSGIDYYFRDETDSPSDASKYLASMYWAMTTLSTVGYGDITPQTDRERAYAMFAMVVGGSLYGYVVGSVTSIVGDIDANAHAYNDRMELIQFWLDRHQDIDNQLRRRVRKHFKLALAERTVMDDRSVISELSPELRADTAHYLIHRHVRHHPMFGGLHNSALARLVFVLQKNHVNSQEFVTRKGEPGEGMYILVRGFARYYEGRKWHPPDATDVSERRFQQVKEGDSFGEEILFEWAETYRYTIITTMDCEFHSISESGFRENFDHLPEVWAEMQERVLANCAWVDHQSRLQLLKAGISDAMVSQVTEETGPAPEAPISKAVVLDAPEKAAPEDRGADAWEIPELCGETVI